MPDLAAMSERTITGAYILHSGIEKWSGGEEQADGVHGMAAGAFPVLKRVPPKKFLRLLAAGEIATGSLLLTPFVPNRVAGAALTGFSGALVMMYARIPALRRPGSIWPSQAGTAVSKDSWMLAIGMALMTRPSRASR
jgi:hypothetical protein